MIWFILIDMLPLSLGLWIYFAIRYWWRQRPAKPTIYDPNPAETREAILRMSREQGRVQYVGKI